MDDLTAFVAARLDEDEAAADDVHRLRYCASVDRDGEFDSRYCDCGYPACMLREVAAKRRMLAELDLWSADEEHLAKLLALAWNDHPDYRAEWTP